MSRGYKQDSGFVPLSARKRADKGYMDLAVMFLWHHEETFFRIEDVTHQTSLLFLLSVSILGFSSGCATLPDVSEKLDAALTARVPGSGLMGLIGV